MSVDPLEHENKAFLVRRVRELQALCREAAERLVSEMETNALRGFRDRNVAGRDLLSRLREAGKEET